MQALKEYRTYTTAGFDCVTITRHDGYTSKQALSYKDYKAALTAGFTTGQEYGAAKAKGFLTAEEWRAAKAGGFHNIDEIIDEYV